MEPNFIVPQAGRSGGGHGGRGYRSSAIAKTGGKLKLPLPGDTKLFIASFFLFPPFFQPITPPLWPALYYCCSSLLYSSTVHCLLDPFSFSFSRIHSFGRLYCPAFVVAHTHRESCLIHSEHIHSGQWLGSALNFSSLSLSPKDRHTHTLFA